MEGSKVGSDSTDWCVEEWNVERGHVRVITVGISFSRRFFAFFEDYAVKNMATLATLFAFQSFSRGASVAKKTSSLVVALINYEFHALYCLYILPKQCHLIIHPPIERSAPMYYN
jgi:hypothetical protein